MEFVTPFISKRKKYETWRMCGGICRQRTLVLHSKADVRLVGDPGPQPCAIPDSHQSSLIQPLAGELEGNINEGESG
jgi:hypothetical protein